MMYMLDSNICIYMIKKKPESLLRRIQASNVNGIAISAITLAELEFGVAKSDYPEKNANALTQILSIINVLSFDANAASVYGSIRADLQRKGTPIGGLDMLIAAHAKSRNLILVTNNVREFQRVEGLLIENWAEQ